MRQKFVADGNVEVQCSISLINYHPSQSNVITELETKRIWLMDADCCVFLTNL